ncbi:MAG: hypothetical protein J6E42_02765 [Firmicutes bacterium]|nr:hypothetical protein [Bacillota bacterium]
MEQWKLLVKKTLWMVLGLFIFGTGSYISIQANIGLGAWEAFQMGIADLIGMSYGNVSLLVGAIIVIFDMMLKEKIGFGTILNAIIIGKAVDLWNWIGLMPKMDNFYLGIVVLLMGQMMISIGTYFYIREGMGGGPRDSLMTALSKCLPKVPVGYIRGMIEGTVLVIGYLMGAKVGLGTVISVFGISFLMQNTFKFFRFDLKSVQHENVVQTVRQLKQGTWASDHEATEKI